MFDSHRDSVNRRRHGERLKPEEEFVAVPTSARAKRRTDCGKRNVTQLLPFEIKYLQLRRSVLLILRNQLSAEDGCALQNRIRLRNNFLPRVALEVAGISDEHAIAWRILVRRDVHLAVADVGVVKKLLSRSQ